MIDKILLSNLQTSCRFHRYPQNPLWQNKILDPALQSVVKFSLLNLEEFLSLSLCFRTLAVLKSTGQVLCADFCASLIYFDFKSSVPQFSLLQNEYENSAHLMELP